MSENQWNYIQTEELIQPPSFKRTKHDGYLEETVDEFVKEVREKYSDLANNYNDVVYKLAMKTTECAALDEKAAQLKQTNESLIASRGEVSSVSQEEHDAALNNVASLEEQLAEARERIATLEAEAAAVTEAEPVVSTSVSVPAHESRPVGPEDNYTYTVRPIGGDRFLATVVEFPEIEFEGRNSENALDGVINLVDDRLIELEERGEAYPETALYVAPSEPVVEQPVVAPAVSSAATLQLTNEKAQALLNAASDQAAQLVKRTEENMIQIEAAATAEAEAIVASAKAAAAEAEERANRFNERSVKIRERMELFFVSQINELRSNQESTGYDPTLPDGSFSG